MDIIVSARHFDLSEALKVQTENAAHAALDDLTLKISSVRVVLDIQKNMHKADVEFTKLAEAKEYRQSLAIQEHESAAAVDE